MFSKIMLEWNQGVELLCFPSIYSMFIIANSIWDADIREATLSVLKKIIITELSLNQKKEDTGVHMIFMQ